MEKRRFGTLPDGRAIDEYILTDGRCRVGVLTLGAILHAFVYDGVDIVAGFDTPGDYLADDSYQGATVGRVCNRIRGGTFEIDGRTVELSRNDGGINHLHGGFCGFQRKVWSAVACDGESVTLEVVSPDGEEGYPGSLTARVTYRLAGDALGIFFEAVCDQKTAVSMTNHAYFHLGGYGTGDILSHTLCIDADRRTAVDAFLTPTGERPAVAGTAYDFRSERPIGRLLADPGRGFDDNFVLNGTKKATLFGQALTEAASLCYGGRRLTLYTDRPCVQLYTGGFLTGGPAMKGEAEKRPLSTVCLEAQTEPDSVRRGENLLAPGEVYRACIVYSLSRDE
ncbi:MAG: galactose mutarotase [Clostridia bacterium]|nr:galactose mutarotase [Clostridia bacterium]